MTAGSGIVHTEEMQPPVNLRILQLWLTLPASGDGPHPNCRKPVWKASPSKRTAIPKSGYTAGRRGHDGTHTQPNSRYLGRLRLESGHEIRQELPASYNGFIYVLTGSVETGPEKTVVKNGPRWLWQTDPKNRATAKYCGKPAKTGHGSFYMPASPKAFHCTTRAFHRRYKR